MKKILLFNPPLFFVDQQPKSLDISYPPLGLLYLASYINKKSKYKAEIVDIGSENKNIDQIIDLIKNKKPNVIGITSMTPQLQGTLELSQNIKKHFPNIPVFLGGPHISADPGFIKRHQDFFDFAITGEAEITFLDSLKKLFAKKKIPLIQSSLPLQDLDLLPFPNKKLIDRKKYKKTESMMFSRGCPFHCYYCSRPSISNIVRYRSAQNLISEIKKCYPFCQGNISFQDDTFTMNRDKVINLCQKIIQKKLKIHWDCNTRIDLVDFELLKIMKKAGCYQINFGIESGNEKLRRDIINKGVFSNQDIQQVFSWCKKIRIKIACYFMIGHPTETKKQLQDTQNMILKSRIDVMGLSIPTPFPGSPLYQIAQKEGIISTKIIDDFAQKKLGVGYSGVYPVYVPKKIGRKYLYNFLKQTNRQFYLNFKTLFSRLVHDILNPKYLKSDIIDFFSLIINGVSSRKPYINKQNGTT